MNKFAYLKDTQNIIVLAILLVATIAVGVNHYVLGTTKLLLNIALTAFFVYYSLSPLFIKSKPLKTRTAEPLFLIGAGLAITFISVGQLYKFQAIGIATILSSTLYLLFRKYQQIHTKKIQDVIRNQLRTRILVTALPILVDIRYNITSMFLSEYYFWIGITSILIIINSSFPAIVKAFKKH